MPSFFSFGLSCSSLTFHRWTIRSTSINLAVGCSRKGCSRLDTVSPLLAGEDFSLVVVCAGIDPKSTFPKKAKC